MKTLTELSKELGINKSPLMKRMDKVPHFRRKYCAMKRNRLVISEKGIRLIDYPKHNSTSRSFHTRKGVKNKNKITSRQKSEIITQLLGYNKRIEKENKSLKHLAKVLKNRNKAKPKITYKSLELLIKHYNSRSRFYRFFHKIKNR